MSTQQRSTNKSARYRYSRYPAQRKKLRKKSNVCFQKKTSKIRPRVPYENTATTKGKKQKSLFKRASSRRSLSSLSLYLSLTCFWLYDDSDDDDNDDAQEERETTGITTQQKERADWFHNFVVCVWFWDWFWLRLLVVVLHRQQQHVIFTAKRRDDDHQHRRGRAEWRFLTNHKYHDDDRRRRRIDEREKK